MTQGSLWIPSWSSFADSVELPRPFAHPRHPESLPEIEGVARCWQRPGRQRVRLGVRAREPRKCMHSSTPSRLPIRVQEKQDLKQVFEPFHDEGLEQNRPWSHDIQEIMRRRRGGVWVRSIRDTALRSHFASANTDKLVVGWHGFALFSYIL